MAEAVSEVAATSGVVLAATGVVGGDTTGGGVAGAGTGAGAISGLVVITEFGVGLVDSGAAAMTGADSDFASC